MSPFATPSAPGAGINLSDLNGALLLFTVRSVEDHVPTVHTKPGEKSPAVKCDVAVLDGPKGGDTHDDTLIFAKVLQSQLNGHVGEMVLGRLGQGVTKPGQNPPWTLTEATPADTQVAEAWVAKQNQFATPQQQTAEAPF